MAGCDGRHRQALADRVKRLINEAFDLSLFHMCKVYILVEHDNGVHTFKSVEQPFWPPSDHRLEEFYPRIERLYTNHLVRTRLTEDERKDLIQLCLYFIHLIKCWQNPKAHAQTNNIRIDAAQIGEYDEVQETESWQMDDDSDDG